MADKHDPKDPGFDWLYSGASASSEAADADKTQAMGRVEPESGSSDPEPTRVQPVSPSHRDDRPATAQGSAARPETANERASSFGGTYPAPPPAASSASSSSAGSTAGSSQTRYATPSPTYTGSPAGRPPSGATPQRPVRRPKNRRWWLRALLLLVIAWLVFLVAVPIWAWQQITRVDADPGGQRPPDTPGSTYLLVGSDSRQDLTKEQRAEFGTGNAAGQRTDTIIMLHVPDGSGSPFLLSVPRDSFVDIPGHSQNKINAAYAFGGPQLLVQTLEGATNVRVDHYIEVGFAGFVDIVDSVGGIEVCPATAIKDPKAGGLTLSRGCQDVDGRTALNYSRSRAFSLGDITRALHQREVITAVGKKAASWQTVVLPWRYFEVNRAGAETVTIGEDVGPTDVARFAWAMAHTGGSDAKRCVVPYSSLGAATSAGTAVLWDDQKASAVFTAIREDDTASADCSPSGR